MSKFTAFCVKGDAFFLEREDYSLLVDGGDSNILSKKPNYFFSLLFSLKSQKLPTYIICTHYDKDHVSGLLELLRYAYKGHLEISDHQLWLPLFCSSCLLSYEKTTTNLTCQNFLNYINFILTNKKTIYERLSNTQSIQAEDESPSLTTEIPKDGLKIKNVINWIHAYFHLQDVFYITKQKLNFLFNKLLLVRDAISYSSELINEAQKLNIKVRFFEHTTATPFITMPSPILPINSKEIKVAQMNVPTFVTALTDVNLESLAFFCTETTSESNVLFCADTDITTCNFSLIHPTFPLKKNILVTAPHHGSSNPQNAGSYKKINLEFPFTQKFYVRGDFHTIRKIASEFKALPQKSCTSRHTTYQKCSCSRCNIQLGQHVQLTDTRGSWAPKPPTQYQ